MLHSTLLARLRKFKNAAPQKVHWWEETGSATLAVLWEATSVIHIGIVAMKTATVLASLLISASVTSAARAETYSELLHKSAAAMMAEEWRTALSHTRELLALPYLTGEQRAAGLTHLCVQLTQVGRTGEALRACNASIALNAKDWGAYVNRGNALSALGYRTAAKADYRKAKELNPTSQAVDVAADMQPATPYVFTRPAYGGGVQQAQGEQLLAEP